MRAVFRPSPQDPQSGLDLEVAVVSVRSYVDIVLPDGSRRDNVLVVGDLNSVIDHGAYAQLVHEAPPAPQNGLTPPETMPPAPIPPAEQATGFVVNEAGEKVPVDGDGNPTDTKEKTT